MNVRTSRHFLPVREESYLIGMLHLFFLPIRKFSGAALGYLVKAGNCSMIKFNHPKFADFCGFLAFVQKIICSSRARKRGGGKGERYLTRIYIELLNKYPKPSEICHFWVLSKSSKVQKLIEPNHLWEPSYFPVPIARGRRPPTRRSSKTEDCFEPDSPCRIRWIGCARAPRICSCRPDARRDPCTRHRHDDRLGPGGHGRLHRQRNGIVQEQPL